ncbi:MAG: hypothetical protein NTY13_02175 [Chlamydiae bacterium]|nr:hypothetical protein [Chlamydiota bacterium]
MPDLTTEYLKKNSKSAFDFVNYCIELARDMMLSDRSCRVPTKVQNRAYQILLEVGQHKDYLSPRAEEKLKD